MLLCRSNSPTRLREDPAFGYPLALDSSRWFVTPVGVGAFWPPSSGRPAGEERHVSYESDMTQDAPANRRRASTFESTGDMNMDMDEQRPGPGGGGCAGREPA